MKEGIGAGCLAIAALIVVIVVGFGVYITGVVVQGNMLSWFYSIQTSQIRHSQQYITTQVGLLENYVTDYYQATAPGQKQAFVCEAHQTADTLAGPDAQYIPQNAQDFLRNHPANSVC